MPSGDGKSLKKNGGEYGAAGGEPVSTRPLTRTQDRFTSESCVCVVVNEWDPFQVDKTGYQPPALVLRCPRYGSELHGGGTGLTPGLGLGWRS